MTVFSSWTGAQKQLFKTAGMYLIEKFDKDYS
jgi:hypothetical protein